MQIKGHSGDYSDWPPKKAPIAFCRPHLDVCEFILPTDFTEQLCA